MKLSERITADPTVRFGRPVIQGTRVPVDLVLGKLAGGMSYDEVCREYELTREDILAVLDFAAHLVGDERLQIAS